MIISKKTYRVFGNFDLNRWSHRLRLVYRSIGGFFVSAAHIHYHPRFQLGALTSHDVPSQLQLIMRDGGQFVNIP